MKKRNLYFLLIIGFALIMTMCNKDDDSTAPPYVGDWESEVFEMMEAMAMMDFNFTETNFRAEISVMIAVGTYLDLLGVKGRVDEKANQILDISLTDIGEYNALSDDYDWKNRTNDAAEFEALYQGYLSTSLPKDFDAEYMITGDRLDLIVASVGDTITLYKK